MHKARLGRVVVACKRMLPQCVGDGRVEAMFRHEAALCGHTIHPLLALPIAAGTNGDGRPWVASRWVEGVPLKTLVRAGGLPVPVVLALLRDLLDVVDAGWNALRLVHRDLAPDNLVLGRDGHCHVVDLGASLSTLGGFQPQGGHMVGRPAWSAPEQLLGRAVDARADVWSVGALAWWMLTGTPLVAAGSPQDALEAAQAGLGGDLLVRRPQVPEALAWWVLGALQPEVERRAWPGELRRTLLAVGRPAARQVVRNLAKNA